MKKSGIYRILHSALALLLSTVMLLSLVPASTLAKEEEPDQGSALLGESASGQEDPDWDWGDKPFHVQYFNAKGLPLNEGDCTMFEELTEGADPIEPACPGQYHEHLWDCEVYEKVTCVDKGVRIYRCLFCDMKQYIFEKPAGHNPGHIINDPEKTYDATCTHPGKITRKCVYCDAEMEEEIPALGHLWVLNVNDSRPAKVRDGGRNVYFCGRTGCTATYTEELEALGDYQLPILRDGTDTSEPGWNNTEYASSLFTVKDQIIYQKSQNGDQEHNSVTVTRGSNLQKYHDQVVIRNYSDVYHFVPGEREGTSRPAIFVYGDALDRVAYAEGGQNPDNMHNYCDITIDMRGENEGVFRDVYLVNFGVTTTKEVKGKTYAYGTKGIGNINIIGNCVNVYLVNSNLGYIDYKGTGEAGRTEVAADGTFAQGDTFRYTPATEGVNIFVDGYNSHLYMGPQVNSSNPLGVHCKVSVRGDMDLLYYDADHPETPFWYDSEYSWAFATNVQQLPVVELSNMIIDCLGRPETIHRSAADGDEDISYEAEEGEAGYLKEWRESYLGYCATYGSYYYPGIMGVTVNLITANGVLDKLGGALLSDCVWNVPDGVDLNEYSSLALYNTQVLKVPDPENPPYDPEPAVIRLHSRAELTVGGPSDSSIEAYGTNKLHLNDAALTGTITACGVSDDKHFTDEVEDLLNDEDDISNGIYYHGVLLQKRKDNSTPGVYYKYPGANLTLLLSGESNIGAESNGISYSPDIMVDKDAILTVQDDPNVEGVGALSVGYTYRNEYMINPVQREDGRHQYCAAIGGTASLDPKPHGWIFIDSGCLTAWTYYGGAAIGGSSQDPYIAYLDEPDGDGNPVIDTENSTPGFSRDGGRITIRGGVLNLTAESGAAAIGGAAGGNGGDVQIKGGTVNANVNGSANGGHAAAIGAGEPWYETGYQLVGYQKLFLTVSDTEYYNFLNVYADPQGTYRYYINRILNTYEGDPKDYTVTITTPGGTERTIKSGDEYLPTDGGLMPDSNSAIYAVKYSLASGGEGGEISITGGSMVNAWADNPLYGTYGNSKPYLENRLYHSLQEGQSSRESISDVSILQDCSADHYSSHGSYYINSVVDRNAEYPPTIRTGYYFKRNAGSGALEMVSNDSLFTETDPYTGETLDHPSYASGRQPGFVLGSTDWAAAKKYGNSLLIGSSRGIDPVVILGQNGEERTAAWDRYYYFNDSLELFYDQTAVETDETGYEVCNGKWYPAIVDGQSLILCYGYDTDRNAYRLDQTDSRLYRRAYRVYGQIDLPAIQGMTLSLPIGTSLTLTDGTVMNVPKGFTVWQEEDGQLIVEEGAVIQGAGLWPNKPADPDNPPTTDQIRSLVERIKGKDPEAKEEVVTHLAIVETSDGKMIIPGNSAESILQIMEAVSLSAKKLITVLNAGDIGFKKSENHGLIQWSLNAYSPDAVVSLVENGALVAVPGPYSTIEKRFDVLLTENNNNVTVRLRSAKLSTPDYLVYAGTEDDELKLTLEPASSKLAFKVELSREQVLNNRCIFSVPKFSGSEFSVNMLAPLKNKCAMRYGGTMKFTTPVSDIAGVNIDELQINYGSSLALGGIKGGGYVKIPSIAGFPVKGSASLNLNTFSPNRELSLRLEMETPIFEGAFEGSFKEARGVILLDTLYAELAVGEGGIPLVPPTVIGYLQGGGLGFSGLADTVNMNSFGAPPIRLQIAAKGSILDVIEGWARVSVGPSGFDLTLEDIEIADADFIKEFGISAGWDAMEKDINGFTYWGVGADMNTYLVVGIPIPGYDYGVVQDYSVAGISATGSVGFGGFAGYKEQGNYLYFVYQLHASGSLKGSLTIPKGLIGGLPLQTMKLLEMEMGFYAAANAETCVDKSEVKTAGNSAMSVLRQLANNVDVSFDAAVGAKAVAGLGKAQCYVRAVYVLGDKGLQLDAGLGAGGEMDLSSYVNSSNTNANNRSLSLLTTAALDGSEEPVPAICQASAQVVTNMAPSIGARGQSDQVSLTKNAMGEVIASVSEAAAGKVIFALELDNQNAQLGAGDLSVKCLGADLQLVPAQFDQNGNQTNADEANFFSEAGTVYFAPSEAGTYTIGTKGNVASIVDGSAIITGAFATLDESTAVDAASGRVSYQVNDPADGGRYKVQLFLGESEGVGDCLLADSGELTAGQLDSALTFSLSGNAAASGSYYPSVLLLEYVEAEDASGQTIGTWAVVDQINYADTVSYANSEEIAAPANVTLTYSGNGTVTANWDQVTGADTYQLAVYEEYAVDSDVRIEDTGLRFRTEDDATSLIMDLSSLYGDDGTAKRYCVGVKAVRYFEDGDRYQTGREGRSESEQLAKAVPPAVSYSDNVALGEGNEHTLAVSADGGSFTIYGKDPLDITVKNADSGKTLDSTAAGVTEWTFTVNDDDLDGEKQLKLQIVAKNHDTRDYVLDYVTVTCDTIAPPLVLDNLGSFPKWKTEAGNIVKITGHTEAGATVYVYRYADGAFHNQSGVYADEDGSFAIPLQFSGTASFCIQAVDSAGNQSSAITAAFPESAINVNLDPNGGKCATASIGLDSGMAIGALPTPTVSDNLIFNGADMAFLGWRLKVTRSAAGDSGSVYETNSDTFVTDEIPVTADMIFRRTDGGKYTVSQMKEMNGKATEQVIATFSKAPTLVAKWDDSVLVTYAPGDGAACAVSTLERTVGAKVGSLPEVRRTDGATMRFLGWYTAPEGGTQITADSTVYADAVYYAHWAEAVTVRFDAGLGGISLTDEESELAKAFTEDGCLIIEKGGGVAEYPDAASTGYAFDGWFTDPNDGSTKVTASTTYSADTTLYARWTRNTALLNVSQLSCSESSALPDPVYTVSDKMVGTPTVSYKGTGSTNYLSTAKPTAAGTYRVTVSYDTFETAYYGSASFSIWEAGSYGFDGLTANGGDAIPASGSFTAEARIKIPVDQQSKVKTVLFACYGENGRFLQMMPVTTLAQIGEGVYKAQTQIPNSADLRCVRVFVLDSEWAPLCASAEITKQ